MEKAEKDGYVCWVGGLPQGIAESEIREGFEKCGEVIKVAIRSSSKDTFAFVTMADSKGKDRAISTLNQSKYFGPVIKVNEKIGSGQFRPKGQGKGKNRSRSRQRYSASASRSRRRSKSRKDSRSRSRSRSRTRSRSRSKNGKDSDMFQIWVGGLPHRITAESLAKEFGRFGKVENTRIKTSPKDTFAWIQYQSKADGQAAIKGMDQSEIFGERITVSVSKETRGALAPQARNERNQRISGAQKRTLTFKMLPASIMRRELRALAEKYGKVLDVQVCDEKNEDLRSSRGHVVFDIEKDAHKACEDLDGRRMEDWDGIMRVYFVHD